MSESVIAISGTILGIFIGFFLNFVRDYFKNKVESKRIINLVNAEIWENAFALIHPENTSYDSIKVTMNNLIISKIGLLNINRDQLLSILKIYELLDRINSRFQIREKKSLKSEIVLGSNTLNELCSRCISLISSYQKKWDKKNLIV